MFSMPEGSHPMRSKFTSSLLLGLTVALAAPTLGGCARMRGMQGYIFDQTLADSIAVGIDNRASVERTLGRPTFASQFGGGQMTSPEQARDWYYLSRQTRQLAFGRPQASSQLVLHVQFDANGNVAAVDRTGVDRVVQLSPNGDKTPTLGRERSFFEELFGNIGTVGAPGAGAGAGSGPGGG